MREYFYNTTLTSSMVSPDYISAVIDRTRSMIDIPEIEILSPIGRLCQPKTIKEICYERAAYIVEKADKRPITLCWSGGIDSTLALTEILKIAPSDQLTLLIDNNSIVEYPDFYTKYILGKIDTRPMSFYSAVPIQEAADRGVIVTGELLDHNFGSIFYEFLTSDQLFQSIDSFLNSLNAYTRGAYSRLIKSCPRKLENLKDFLWWMTYALDYQDMEFKWLTEVGDLIIDENIFHFGGGSSWNDFAVSTPAECKYFGDDIRNYKMSLKQQIFEFTKDHKYTAEKIKIPSLRRYGTRQQRGKPAAIFIKTDWTRGWGL